jgi:hypothetical protein
MEEKEVTRESHGDSEEENGAPTEQGRDQIASTYGSTATIPRTLSVKLSMSTERQAVLLRRQALPL